jgi:hypothetical protein
MINSEAALPFGLQARYRTVLATLLFDEKGSAARTTLQSLPILLDCQSGAFKKAGPPRSSPEFYATQ